MSFGVEPPRPVREAHKMAPSRSLGGKRTGGNLGGDIQHQDSETAGQLLLTVAVANTTPL